MRISEGEQNERDFDWYCVDKDGRIGHFASAGFKRIPPSVEESAEDLRLLDEFFKKLSTVPEGHQLDERLTSECRTERYLHSYIAMADRGLFSFDIESHLKAESCYFRVAIPKRPLLFAELPEGVQKVLGRTRLLNYSLQDCSSIPYAATLAF